jgi:hypothetical protein
MRDAEHELDALRDELARVTATQRRLARALVVASVTTALALGAVVLLHSTEARSDPSTPVACNPSRASQVYCFQPSTPALASQVNSNFESAFQAVDKKADIGAPYFPVYSSWGSLPFGAGGAGIVNDNNNYKTLMIVGNTSAGGAREVGLWDDARVSGNLTVGQGLSVPNYAWSGGPYDQTDVSKVACDPSVSTETCPQGSFVCGITFSHICGDAWYNEKFHVQCCKL